MISYCFQKLGFWELAQSAGLELPEERYQRTLQALLTNKVIWCLLDETDETITLDFQEKIHVCIWPDEASAQEFARLEPDSACTPHPIALEAFLQTARQLAADPIYRFAVYPTDQDLWIVEPEALLSDLYSDSMQSGLKGRDAQ